MTVTKERLSAALVAWIEQEIVSRVGGLAKVAMEMGVLLLVPQKVEAALPHLEALGVATKDGQVDVDLLYKTAKAAMQKTGSVKQCFMGTDVTFTPEDIDALYAMLKAQ